MEIKDLKQPYKRMAEYLVTQNCIQETVYGIYNRYPFSSVDHDFWDEVDNWGYPPITPEIKKHFPADFDFSYEEENLNQKYTQLAKEGRFDELPDTCEFSEPVELESWEYEGSENLRKITGKFKGNYMDIHCIGWKNAQLPTPKIDFSEFKAGDVVEVLTKSQGFFWGMFSTNENDFIRLTFGTESGVTKHIYKDQINLITKIK